MMVGFKGLRTFAVPGIFEVRKVGLKSARDRSVGIEATTVRNSAGRLPSGAAVLDLGCGSGFPNTEMLLAEGLNVYAVDASPSLVQAFQRNLPNTPVACEAVEDSTLFHRIFNGVLAWGLNSRARYKESPTQWRLVAPAVYVVC
jgi:SAM-dependent methyltransferase